MLEITPDIAQMIEDTDLFYQGLPPVAGGTLDQSARFIAAARFIRTKQDEVISEIRQNNG